MFEVMVLMEVSEATVKSREVDANSSFLLQSFDLAWQNFDSTQRSSNSSLAVIHRTDFSLDFVYRSSKMATNLRSGC